MLGRVCAGSAHTEMYICAPLSLQGTQMSGCHWEGQACALPPTPTPTAFPLLTSLSASLAHCVSTFPTHSASVRGGSI